MKIRRTVFGLLQLSGIFYLFNFMGACGSSAPANNPSTPATIAITPQPTFIPAGTTVTFTASTTNANGYTPAWTILYNAPAGSGTLSAPGGTTVTYTAPATPPIYSALVSGQTQGSVSLEAYVENIAGCNDTYAYANFIVTAPSVTVGLAPATASVAVGTTAAFTGYAVGSTNAALTWQVNGVTGGSLTYGSIVATGTTAVYTAPAAIPMTGPTVTITVLSQADPTKSATATVTLH